MYQDLKNLEWLTPALKSSCVTMRIRASESLRVETTRRYSHETSRQCWRSVVVPHSKPLVALKLRAGLFNSLYVTTTFVLYQDQVDEGSSSRDRASSDPILTWSFLTFIAGGVLLTSKLVQLPESETCSFSSASSDSTALQDDETNCQPGGSYSPLCRAITGSMMKRGKG